MSDAVATVDEVLRALATRRPVFHSEADFQHAFAWTWQQMKPDARIRLEARPFPGERVALDVLVTADEQRVAIELKHLVRKLDVEVDGERFVLAEQGAHDLGRYDVVKDLVRLERLVGAGVVDVGVAVVLSNDARYWTPAAAATDSTVGAAFRLAEGGTLQGELAWTTHAGPGTTRGREAPHRLVGSYEPRWRDYAIVAPGPAGTFRALVVPVEAGPQLARPVRATAAQSGTPRPSRGDLTARQAILEAFKTLEVRRGTDFFEPKEIIAEARRYAPALAESTLRTHIVSAMCVNAPANHAVRYPDLERVGRGLYRRVRRDG